MPRKRVKESGKSKEPKRQKTTHHDLKDKERSAVASSSSSLDAPSKLFLAQFLTDPTWKEKLCHVYDENYFLKLDKAMTAAYSDKRQKIFPPKEMIFNAFNTTPFDQVKVVILGQDPYHDDNQAHGLSFSVTDGTPFPPSLKNIFKELGTDIPGFKTPASGCLTKWAKRGVLLLNATLTVVAHQPNSHSKLGWQQLTDEVIRVLSHLADGVVFLLWGGFAHKKEKLIDGSRQIVIKTAHPSPLSFKKFEGCKCFSEVNKALVKLGKEPIDWTL